MRQNTDRRIKSGGYLHILELVKAGDTMRDRLPFGYIFLAGLVAGIITMNFGKSILLEDTGLLDADALSRLSAVNFGGSAFFAFILRKRMVMMGAFAVAATTYLGIAACVIGAGWYGFSAGAFVAAGVLRYGVKGFLLTLAAVFPQYLIYGPAIYGLFLWCEKTYRMIYDRNYFPEKKQKAPVLTGRALSLLALTALMLAGCALESFVNPAVLKGFLKLLRL